MIKVTNWAALKLMAPTIERWDVWDVIRYPQSIHYIDCTLLDGDLWRSIIEDYPEFYGKCTEHNGWYKMDGDDWWLLLRRQPQFADKCTEYNGWDKMEEKDRNWLLSDNPTLVKYNNA